MKQLSYLHFLLAVSCVISGCAKLPLQTAILEEVYQNEENLLQVKSEETRKNIRALTKAKIARKKLLHLNDYCAYVEQQKKLNAQTLAPCKTSAIQLKPLADVVLVPAIAMSNPSSPAMRYQLEMANQQNEQMNQQRVEELRYLNFKTQSDAELTMRAQWQKCKADSVANAILLKQSQEENYLQLLRAGNKLKVSFSRANRRFLTKN